MKYKFKYSYIIYANFIFFPFSFAFSIHVAVLATGSPNSVSGLPLLAFLAFSPFLWDVLI